MQINLFFFLVLLPAVALGQQPGPPPAADVIRPTYVLGAGDQIVIRAAEMEDISDRPVTIDGDGMITLPSLGRVKVAGLSVQDLEADLVERLRPFVRTPQVIITVVQFRTEPVFFVGAFQKPGIYPLLGRRTLVEMLASIGGVQPNASRRIKVTRRAEAGKIPLESAIEDPVNNVSSVEISVGSLRQNVNPAEDIVLQAYDVISVERAEMVYVNGAIGRVGGFELGERDSVSVVQVLSLAGGMTGEADAKGARVLRPILDSSRRAEIPLDLNKILKGEANDFPLQPNDVLYIPPKSALWPKVGRIALAIVPGILVGLAVTSLNH